MSASDPRETATRRAAAEIPTPPGGLIAGVLVGGASRRMGRPKHLLPHPAGGTFLEHAVGLARSVATQAVILGDCAELPASLADLPRLADAVAGGGPLAGLCSLLAYAGKRWTLLLACDMPRLEAATLGVLLGALRDAPDPASVEAVVFVEHDEARRWPHPCCALYHPAILPRALEVLCTGGGRMGALLDRVALLALAPTPAQRARLANVNTPADLSKIAESR